MNLTSRYMTRNDCYTAGRTIVPKGIMVHSTAAPGVMAASWFPLWNKSYVAGETSRQVCVHAFVDDTGVWQYLPWDRRGWHAGGSANNTHIGFEICEPAGFRYKGGANMVGYDAGKQEGYFRKVWDNAVELCVFLCRKFGLNEQNILCHSEGFQRGIASNHGDVMHWFPKHGESMESFRLAVRDALRKEEKPVTQTEFDKMLENWMVRNNPTYRNLSEVPDYWRKDVEELQKAGAVLGDGTDALGLERNTVQAVIIAKRWEESRGKL